MNKWKDCYLKKEGEFFIFGNSKIERRICLKKGIFYTTSFYDKENKKEWIGFKDKDINSPDFSFDGITSIKISDFPFKPLILKDIEAEVEKDLQNIEVFKITFYLIEPFTKTKIRRIYFFYPEVSVIINQSEISSLNYPVFDFYTERENVCDRLSLKREIIYEGKAIEFFTRTDKTNQLVKEENFYYKEGSLNLKGNFIYLSDIKDKCGIFVLKESPVSSDLRPEVKSDFEIYNNELKIMGWGIRPEELGNLKWRKSYKVVIGTYKGKEIDAILKLKEYQMKKYRCIPERDYMIMANPWGDGNVYNNLCEEFVLKELESCYKFGITHYQIDDGWQKGGKAIDIINNKAIDKNYWKINKKNFPNSFYRISEKAKELGIKLGLWFVPDRNRQYQDYKKDVDIIFDFYERFGMKIFKLDAINIQTKNAEENFELFLKEIYKKSKGEIIFNFDVTGAFDRRPGYFYLLEYGNIFLENRYTDIKNDFSEKKYYPFKTLRNLWQLSKYVLPQKLQIEVLNISLNRDKYSEKDILAPYNYSWEYCFSISFFSNPLFWGEISKFPKEALKSLKPLINLHKKYRNEFFSSYIIPFGEIPDGFKWAGFISIPENPNKNLFILIFRENTHMKEFEFTLDLIENRDFSLLYASSECFFSFNKSDFKIKLENPNSFAILKGKIL